MFALLKLSVAIVWFSGLALSMLRPADLHILKELREAQPNCNALFRGKPTARVTDDAAGIHMFGYFDKSPWSAGNRWFLASRIPTYNRHLSTRDTMQLMLLDWERACITGKLHWRWLANSSAWNLQQGAMAQWLGATDLVIYNDRGPRCASPSRPDAEVGPDTTCSVVVNATSGQRLDSYPAPVYSVNAQGTLALAINQTALFRVLRGFGHVTSHPVPHLLPCSATDGVWVVDLADPSAPPRLLVSLRQAWEHILASGDTDVVTGQPYRGVIQPGEVEDLLAECNHWINTPQFSKEGEFVSFIYRLGYCRGRRTFSWKSSQLMMHLPSGRLWKVPLVQVSHADWGWAGTHLVSDESGYHEIRWHTPVQRWWPAGPRPLAAHVVGVDPGAAAEEHPFLGDGHGSFAPGAGLRYLVSDTYPRNDGSRRLFVTDRHKNISELLGVFKPVNESGNGDWRVDLHPRWDRTGRFVCFDASHEGSRQVYVGRPSITSATAEDTARLLSRAASMPVRRVMLYGHTHIPRLLEALEAEGLAPHTALHLVDPRSASLLDLPKHTSLRAVEHVRALASDRDVPAAAVCEREGGGLQLIGRPGMPVERSVDASLCHGGRHGYVRLLDVSQHLARTASLEEHVTCRLQATPQTQGAVLKMVRDGTVRLCDALVVEWGEGREEESWWRELKGELDAIGIAV
ncbi:hypothetical protein HYH03_015072 [Edaphochlamys debaryana]|uniref:Uncharacterized protein n=1 Tax=Edaphochlamys debaryana TaxID=47281 RepID=A0A835XNY3_9CHLO|nr:hypothetical protein HYH03_015072 [Edaphochlamys debaryana]|eukprot:KAG2486248.1 hypothetical protein HYH03_015072 [Edaphochlamys debaryana]